LSKLRQSIQLGSGTTTNPVENSSVEEFKIRHVAEQLQNTIKAVPIQNTRVIEVTVSGTDPDLATNIANEIANVFITYNLQSITSEAKSAYEFTSEQLKVVEKKLREAEQDLKAFKEKEGVVELTEEARITLEKLSAIETSYDATIAQRQEAEARRDIIRKELEAQDETITSSTTITENPLVQQLQGQLYDFEIELAGLLKVYPQDAPQVEQINTKISLTKERLAKEVERVVTSEISSINPVHQDLVSRLVQLEADVIAYEAMAEAQKTFVEQYRTELARLPSKELQLARLTRDKNVSDQIYMLLMQRKEEAQLAQAIQVGNVSVADPAIKPLRPYKPQKKVYLMLGVVLGLMLGLGVAFFLEYMDNTFRTEEDVKRYLKLPFLGSVPFIKSQPVLESHPKTASLVKHPDTIEDAQRKAIANPVRLSEQEARMLTHLSPRAPETEAYRMLTTNIQFAEVDESIHTLLITSSGPGEGKTITATNLSVVMAQGGKKTLLVDTDLRKPAVHRVFRLEREPGVTEFLLGKVELQEIIKNSQVENLSVITSGATPPNAPQLLASQKMKDFIKELKEQFEIILFDSPPAIVVTDPAILGQELDATCLVIEAERTDKDAALKAKELLTTANANLLGVIFNKIDVRKRYGYYYYYYYYYGGHEEKRKKRRRR
jgi:polysaccharide chain length determinant protein (PEP-CTERM system associated)